jgi:hypothetical protein
MVLYEFFCPDCGVESVIKNPIDKDFPSLFCEKCKVLLKQRIPFLRTITCTNGHAIRDRCKQEASSNMKAIEKGDENKLSDLVGDTVNPLKR